MKLQFKLDKKTLQQFLLDHSEKVVLGVVGIFFLFVTYSALMRKGYIEPAGKDREHSQPETLVKDVKDAEAYIARPFDPKLPDPHFAEDISKFRESVDPKQFAIATVLYHPPTTGTVLREMPPVLKVERLVAEAGRGPLAIPAGAGRVGPGPGPRPGEHGPRDKVKPAREAPPASARGQRWVLVKGLVPLKEQTKVFQNLYQNASFHDAKQDTPNFYWFYVQRAEVPTDGSAPLNYDTLYDTGSARQAARRFAGSDSEVVDAKFIRPGLCLPLLPATDRNWGEEVAYLPEIPVGDRPGPEPPDQKNPLPGDTGPVSPDDPQPEPGGIKPPGGFVHHPPGAAPGAAPAEPVQQPDYLLFRFFDLNVQPGKAYRYRVFLVLANPNHDVELKYLKNQKDAKPKWVGQDADTGKLDASKVAWSDPSPVVVVPADTQLLALSTTGTLAVEPTGKIGVVHWQPESGINAREVFSVVRGKIANFFDDKTKVNYVTNSLIVDMAGYRQPGAARPSRFLVLDQCDNPDQPGKLVVHDEIEDEKTYEKLVPTTVKTHKVRPPGVRGKEKDEFEEHNKEFEEHGKFRHGPRH